MFFSNVFLFRLKKKKNKKEKKTKKEKTGSFRRLGKVNDTRLVGCGVEREKS